MCLRLKHPAAFFIAVFCNSPRTNSQFGVLASQIAEPGQRKNLVEAFRQHLATNPRSPFLLDLHPLTENWCRYRTQIFDKEECSIVYCPKKYYNEQRFAPEITTSFGS
ncbi:DNA-directed RNA polymerase subunit beta [Frankliniella fusca]|uniref:DNA-directed RNA polymerase subunit beta n=1 Tax=Frankliniella fusca TaxID=407009 RepID=A0AAE1H6W6_9NEOP|nr:DNA-directed RNA polymerase subunit beta [Frankliniella fusca]KAK3915683.1 DNA-directed RNA polymerase subunit beta [Frankliniella fusca]KAK3917117.1 DNA-directed RNA polymerase subunit beta [Frankliniella fusca]KAK3920742.1 DNA-directed RNA polymerase subunit beta [Frankliniella fusca]KAK3924816.1 DNA-directed RNA polymerase subunit beta [Frankliniella fusca]